MNADERIIFQIRVARLFRVGLWITGVNIRNADRRRLTKQIALEDHRRRVAQRKDLPRSPKPPEAFEADTPREGA